MSSFVDAQAFATLPAHGQRCAAEGVLARTGGKLEGEVFARVPADHAAREGWVLTHVPPA